MDFARVRRPLTLTCLGQTFEDVVGSSLVPMAADGGFECRDRSVATATRIRLVFFCKFNFVNILEISLSLKVRNISWNAFLCLKKKFKIYGVRLTSGGPQAFSHILDEPEKLDMFTLFPTPLVTNKFIFTILKLVRGAKCQMYT